MYGLENLASIPGTVGASPIQNIGAYGKQVDQYISSVEVFDPKTQNLLVFSRQDCHFGYRDSIFKQSTHKHLIVVAVTFELSNNPSIDCEYEPVASILRGLSTSPVPKDVYDIVREVRSSKLPDTVTHPNTGSTFKNPILSKKLYENIRTQYPNMPSYIQEDGLYKVPAGWLIETA